jgi:hypothetical protein
MERARGERDGQLSEHVYSITENIYYSQLSSDAILLQPEPNCFTSHNTRKGLCYFSLCAIVLRSLPPSHVATCNGQRNSQLFSVHCNDFRQRYVIKLMHILGHFPYFPS